MTDLQSKYQVYPISKADRSLYNKGKGDSP